MRELFDPLFGHKKAAKLEISSGGLSVFICMLFYD